MATFTSVIKYGSRDDKKHSAKYQAQGQKPLIDTVYVMREAMKALTGSDVMPDEFEIELRVNVAAKGDTKPAKASNVSTLRKRG